jgi:DNA-binding beta-propeller fold protein YncE
MRARRLRSRTTAVIATVTLAAGLLGVSASVAGQASGATPSGARHLALARTRLVAGQPEFAGPDALAVDGGGLWVANRASSSLTEVNPTTGAWMRTVSGAGHRLSSPVAMVADGAHLFVANANGSVSDLDALNGSFTWTISAKQLREATAMVAVGSRLFVLSAAGLLTEWETSSGALIRVVSGARYGFAHPSAIVAARSHLWITNRSGDSLTEVDAGTGSWVRTVSGSEYSFDEPSGIAFDGAHLWVADSGSNEVTEIDPASGALIRVINSGKYGLNTPAPMTSWGAIVYVVSPPGRSPMVTAIWTAAGSLDWMWCNTNKPSPHFDNPSALVVHAGMLWVANEGNGSLTEMNATTAAVTRIIA